MIEPFGGAIAGTARRYGKYSRLAAKTFWYTAFFIFPLLCGFSSLHASVKAVEVGQSSPEGLEFTISFHTLSDLTRVVLPDSSVAFVKTVQVGMPNGATARLVSADGAGLLPIDNELGVSANRPLVGLAAPRLIRGHQVMAVQLCPVAGSGIYQQVHVRLAFSGGQQGLGERRPDPIFDKLLASTVVNFDQAKSWGTVEKAAASAAVESNPFALSSQWLKLFVRQTGLYRVTGAQLEAAGISLTGLASDSIRLFNGGGRPSEMDNAKPRPEFKEIAVKVDDGGDGVFGANDVLYFYGEALNRWVYGDSAQAYWLKNMYSPDNVYWLTVASGGFDTPPVRMASTSAVPTGGADTTVTTFRRRVHVEQDNLLLTDGSGHIDNYYEWYWTDQTSLNLFVPTPGVIPGDSASVLLVGRTGVSGLSHYMAVTINGVPGLNPILSTVQCRFGTKSLVDGMNDVAISLTPNASNFRPYFNYLEISYLSQMTPAGGQLDITLNDIGARQSLVQVMDNFAAAPFVLDLTDTRRPGLLVGYTRSGGVLSFETATKDGGANHFYCVVPAAALAPAAITKVTPVALREVAGQSDLIIVTPQAFVSAMDEYVQFRQADGYSVRVVPVEAIFDNFSWGLTDPTAIRDFLKFAYETSPAPAPSAVLLAGDANYDMLNRLKTNVPNYVPSYINPLEAGFIGASYGDDNYVYFGPYGILDADHSYWQGGRGFDMMTSRWPIRTRADIASITQKVRSYESSTDFGLWRTIVTLVADDEFGQFNSETFHVTQTEELQQSHLPAYFIRNKIYSWDYPFVNNQKPAVNDAIVNAINSGTLVVNYVGHGNPDVWAHEHILTRTGDLPKLHNLGRLPLVFTASCAIGFFDDPGRQAMGEDFLTMPTGGAVAVISAMRLVFSSDNAAFNRQVYDLMMYSDSLTMCQAVYGAKMLRQYGADTIPHPEDNDRSYIFFGDPLQKLGLPKLRIEFTETPDSLEALGRTRVAGHVVDANGATVARNGSVLVNVFDPDRSKTYRLADPGGQEVTYNLTGPTLFRGSTAVTDGEFNLEFISPLDISFGRNGARILTYAVLDTVDAVGLVDSLRVSNQVASVNDSAGPTIEYTLGGRTNFVSGDLAVVGDTLQVTLSDSSGINVAGGLGHGITLEVDNHPEQVVNLTGLFTYAQNSYTTGRLSYPLTGLEAGEHQLKIKAWDNANNSSTVQFTVNLVTGANLAIQDLLNYPNPMNGVTTFYFELTRDVQQMTLDIFTLAGRKIRSMSGQGLGAGYYDSGRSPFVWDGRDTSGDRVATGVYIYKATAVPRGGGEAAASFGKIVVIN